MVEESSGVQTKWNFDDERMKALSTYMTYTEDSFASFTSYRGMNPVEELYGWLSTIKRAILGTGKKTQEDKLKKEIKELEKIKRGCNSLFLSNLNDKKIQREFVNKTIEFYNKAEQIFELINKMNVAGGLYFRKKDDPRRAMEW